MVVNVTNTSVTLSWTAPNMSNGIIIHYNIEYKETHESLYNQLLSFGTSLNATITWLSPNTTYQFRVAAVTVAGCGPYTDEINLTTTICKLLYQMMQYS